MEFVYVIVFNTIDGRAITRTGAGLFYPTDVKALRLEDQLWAITEEYNVRPESIEVFIQFKGEYDGETTPKRIEGPKTETPR